MIVFEQDEYIFINKVDNTQKLSLKFKITQITKQHVPVPELTANSVIIWKDGTTETKGTPKPGGIIYLQNDYVAICYTNTTSYELIVSESYQYYDEYRNLFPTRHRSTPLARLLRQNPLNMAFVRDGVLSNYDEFVYNGLQANYMAIDNGDVSAYFEVKSQQYYSCPVPASASSADDLNWKALIGHVGKVGTKAYYSLIGEVPGLIKTDKIVQHIKEQRKLMYEYKPLTPDLDICTAFEKPGSDSMRESCVVNSALDVENAQIYLQTEQNLGHILDDLLAGIVIGEKEFQEILEEGIKENNLLEFVRGNNIPTTTMVLLNSDFQKFLTQYRDEFERVKREIATAALSSMCADLTEMKATLNTVMKQEVKTLIENIIYKKFSGIKGVQLDPELLKPNFIVQMLNQELVFLENAKKDPTNPLYSGDNLITHGEDILKQYGHDLTLTIDQIQTAIMSGDASFSFLNPSLMKEKPRESIMLTRALAAVVVKVETMLDNALAAFKGGPAQVPTVDVKIKQDYKRFWLPFANGHDWHFKVYNDKPMNVYITNMYFTKTSIVADCEATFDEFDTDSNGYKGRIESLMRDEIKKIFEKAGWNAENINAHWPSWWTSPSIDRDTQFRSANVNWGSTPYKMSYKWTMTTGVNLSFMFSALADLETTKANCEKICQFIPDHKVTSGIIDGAIEKVEGIVSVFRPTIEKYAANEAYKKVKPLLNSLVDSSGNAQYKFNVLCCIGGNYDGIVADLNDVSYICHVSQAYVETLQKLIEDIKDIPSGDTLYNALAQFRSQLSDLKFASDYVKPVYYLSKNNLSLATPVVNPNAFYHYLLGAFNV